MEELLESSEKYSDLHHSTTYNITPLIEDETSLTIKLEVINNEDADENIQLEQNGLKEMTVIIKEEFPDSEEEMRIEYDQMEQPDINTENIEVGHTGEISHSFGETNPSGNSSNHSEIPSSKPYKCIFCKRHFSYEASLRTHLTTVHKFYHNCSICELEFTDVYQLVGHVTSTEHCRNLENKHKCSICNKSFSINDVFETHVTSMHPGEKLHKCGICAETFSLKTRFYSHLKSKHFEPNRCRICLKTFSSEKSLRIHMYTNHDKKYYECSICKEIFSFKNRLTAHMRTSKHFKLKKKMNNKCKICGETFSLMAYLDYHTFKIHSKKLEVDAQK